MMSNVDPKQALVQLNIYKLCVPIIVTCRTSFTPTEKIHRNSVESMVLILSSNVKAQQTVI